ncbi:MAG: ABC transporter ATP-binding protein, partial [Candidatus Omnitrophica bacterium]|nr:ABC transporter ATP-binding protein [Candidatus Omnitrophota bacterium]
LKLLSRITYPAEGEIRLGGRVGSLLEVGTGFHPELTGRENIYFNGSILGMRKREIDKNFDEIVDFSGVEKFLDTPVKRFSSGMQVRLAFSVAAHLDPEILLIDEVLAVGDAQFQKKCLGKMKNVSEGGRTILFVSHNMTAIRNLCKRTLMLEHGKLILDSDTDSVVQRYLDRNLSMEARVSADNLTEKVEGIINRNDPTIRFKEVNLLNQRGLLCNGFQSTEEITISVTYECLKDIFDLRLIMQIVDEENRTILLAQNTDDSREAKYYEKQPGVYTSSCTIAANTFGQKRFYISLQLINLKIEHLILNKILMFDVNFLGYNLEHGDFGDAFLRPRLTWNTNREA